LRHLKKKGQISQKYKKTGDKEFARLAKTFTGTLKKTVKKEARRTFQCKARSPDPAHFWQAVNSCMGKTKDKLQMIEINNEQITDPNKLCNLLQTSFSTKSTDFQNRAAE